MLRTLRSTKKRTEKAARLRLRELPTQQRFFPFQVSDDGAFETSDPRLVGDALQTSNPEIDPSGHHLGGSWNGNS